MSSAHNIRLKGTSEQHNSLGESPELRRHTQHCYEGLKYPDTKLTLTQVAGEEGEGRGLRSPAPGFLLYLI